MDKYIQSMCINCKTSREVFSETNLCPTCTELLRILSPSDKKCDCNNCPNKKDNNG